MFNKYESKKCNKKGKCMTRAISEKIVSANIICTILIICLHTRYEYDGFYNIIGTLSDAAVPVFFAISSYLYYEKFDWNRPLNSYGKSIQKRVFSLLVPYVIFSSLGFLVFTGKAIFKNEILPCDITSFKEVFAYICLSKGNPPLWYLTSLFEFVLLAPIIGYAVKTTKFSLLLMPITIYYCHNLSYSNIFFWLPVLIFGCYCSIWWNFILKVFRNVNLLYLSILGVVLWLFICFSFYDITDRNSFVYYVYRVMTPIIFLVLMGRMPPKHIWINMKNYTLFVYCSHSLILFFLFSIIKKLPYSFYIYIVSIGIVLLISVGIGYIVKKRCFRLWKILNGGR